MHEAERWAKRRSVPLFVGQGEPPLMEDEHNPSCREATSPDADANIFIGNLPPTVTRDTLTELLTQLGPLAGAVRLLLDGRGVPKGIAFAEFADVCSAEYAVAVLHALPLGKGYNLRCNRASDSARNLEHARVATAPRGRLRDAPDRWQPCNERDYDRDRDRRHDRERRRHDDGGRYPDKRRYDRYDERRDEHRERGYERRRSCDRESSRSREDREARERRRRRFAE